MKITARLPSNASVTGGFAALLLSVFVKPIDSSVAEHPLVTSGFILIVLGVVARAFTSSSGDPEMRSASRVCAVGAGLAAIGILLEAWPVPSTVLIVSGFAVFGLGVLLVLPKARG
jgi:hypothetical protein